MGNSIFGRLAFIMEITVFEFTKDLFYGKVVRRKEKGDLCQ